MIVKDSPSSKMTPRSFCEETWSVILPLMDTFRSLDCILCANIFPVINIYVSVAGNFLSVELEILASFPSPLEQLENIHIFSRLIL